MGRAWLRALSACTPSFPVPVCGVGVRAGVWVSAAPRHSLGGCWGVCVLVRPPRVVSCTSWSGVQCGGACLCARPACSPPFLAGVCCVGVRAGPGSRLCSPFWVGLSGCVFFLGVLVAGCPCPGPCGPCRPIPSLSGWVAGSFLFFFVPAWCVSAGFGFPFSRWAAAPGLVLPVLAGWSPRAPLGVLSSVPSGWGVWPPLVVLAGGLVAVGRSLAPPPPSPPVFFFWGGGLPVPPSAFPWLAHALGRSHCGLPGCCWRLRSAWPCPGPMGRMGYVHVGLGAPSCPVRSWLCRLGGCARWLGVALG